MSIKKWPKNERPREKLWYQGAAVLSDAELLAILLRTGAKGKSAVDIARELIQQFGGLRKLLDIDKHFFCNISGLGMTKYVQLQAALEFNRRYLFESVSSKKKLTNTQSTKDYLVAKFSQFDREVFGCLFLNSKYQVLSFRELFFGTLNKAEIYSRELIKAALAEKAAAVMFVHNHPSGDLQPSQSDITTTQKLKEVLMLVEVLVLDHIIVSHNKAVSLSELGMM